jgi:acyl-CoA hydrolase
MRIAGEEQVRTALDSLPGSEPRVVVAGNFATPWTLLRLLDRTRSRYRVFVLNPQPGWPRRAGVITESPFIGPGVRGEPDVDYLPMRLSLVPRLFDSVRPPDAVLLHTSTPRDGKVSLGIEVNILPAAVEVTRRRGGVVVAQLNPNMPYTLGDAELDLDLVDLGVEVDGALSSPVPEPITDDVSEIGERVARFGSDGCTLQLGIGRVPDATAVHLRSLRGVGVWSEMVGSGILDLLEGGVLDRSRSVRASFMFGSPELYRWADGNPALRMTRTETINDPALIASHPAMLSVNTALQLDLYAQANACYVGGRVHSGFGGQPDFVVGALHSKGGHAVITLRSWHEKTGRSTIVPILPTPVTSMQHTAVVTDQGCAEVFGRSNRAQARLIIEHAAHPLARDELREALARMPGDPGSLTPA